MVLWSLVEHQKQEVSVNKDWLQFFKPSRITIVPMAGERDEEIASLKRALLEHREVDARAKKMREDSQGLNAAFKKSENDLKGRF